MSAKLNFAPPNSLVLIMDLKGGEIPKTMTGKNFSATDSCIAIGCRSEVDGQTAFTLGELYEVDPGYPPAFSSNLKTPSQRVVVRSVYGEKLLEAPTSNLESKIRIWVNSAEEPDIVIIGIS